MYTTDLKIKYLYDWPAIVVNFVFLRLVIIVHRVDLLAYDLAHDNVRSVAGEESGPSLVAWEQCRAPLIALVECRVPLVPSEHCRPSLVAGHRRPSGVPAAVFGHVVGVLEDG